MRPGSRETGAGVSEPVRERLRRLADDLIPAANGMPSAAEVGVAEGQLDLVLEARPDLGPLIERGLAGDTAGVPPRDALASLEAADPAAHHAIVLAIVAGYYMHPLVRTRMGYPGQTGAPVVLDYGDVVASGLLDPVVERGPIYRPTPSG